jgi:hypothetical protein
MSLLSLQSRENVIYLLLKRIRPVKAALPSEARC